MKLVRITYPHEVAFDTGENDVCYPTLAEALADAEAIYAGWSEAYRVQPAVVERIDTGKIGPRELCNILNSGGGQYVAGRTVIGRVVWVGTRTAYRRASGPSELFE